MIICLVAGLILDGLSRCRWWWNCHGIIFQFIGCAVIQNFIFVHDDDFVCIQYECCWLDWLSSGNQNIKEKACVDFKKIFSRCSEKTCCQSQAGLQYGCATGCEDPCLGSMLDHFELFQYLAKTRKPKTIIGSHQNKPSSSLEGSPHQKSSLHQDCWNTKQKKCSSLPKSFSIIRKQAQLSWTTPNNVSMLLIRVSSNHCNGED